MAEAVQGFWRRIGVDLQLQMWDGTIVFSNTRTITKLIWQKQIEKHPHETHGYAKGWAT